MELSYAFALNTDNKFGKNHFGDADKFAIYRRKDDAIVFDKEVQNPFKNFDEGHQHGSGKKGAAIIDFLKSHGVNVLVSRQFGKNITMVNKHFIPIIINTETPEEVAAVLNKHRHWIWDEWNSSSSEHKLFKMKSSVLKLRINDK